MSQVLHRKDHTSISCPQRSRPRYSVRAKARGMEFVVAVSLIALGVWLMVGF